MVSAAVWSLGLLWAGTARAQLSDGALQRLEEVNALRVGVLRFSGAAVWRPGASGSTRSLDGAPSFGFVLAGMEKRGALWEAVRLDHLRAWIGEGTGELAFTVADIDMSMFGAGQDHQPCMASWILFSGGDCVSGGAIGFRLQLLHHQWESEQGRWFHRYVEAGTALSFLGDSFDIDFVRHRLPVLVGASLDHVAHAALPTGETSDLRLRGAAGLDLVWRPDSMRLEAELSVRYRPSLVPFEVTEDWALEARAHVAYLWLAGLLGSVKDTVHRLFLDVSYAHWRRPWLADSFTATQRRDTFELQLGIEVTFRDLSPT